MLEKFLMGSLVLGMLLAFGLAKSFESDRSHMAVPAAADPGSVTIDLRRR